MEVDYNLLSGTEGKERQAIDEIWRLTVKVDVTAVYMYRIFRDLPRRSDQTD